MTSGLRPQTDTGTHSVTGNTRPKPRHCLWRGEEPRRLGFKGRLSEGELVGIYFVQRGLRQIRPGESLTQEERAVIFASLAFLFCSLLLFLLTFCGVTGSSGTAGARRSALQALIFSCNFCWNKICSTAAYSPAIASVIWAKSVSPLRLGTALLRMENSRLAM